MNIKRAYLWQMTCHLPFYIQFNSMYIELNWKTCFLLTSFSSSLYLRGKENFYHHLQTCIKNYKSNIFTPKVPKKKEKSRG